MSTLILSGSTVLHVCDSVRALPDGSLVAVVGGIDDAVYPLHIGATTVTGVKLPADYGRVRYSYSGGEFVSAGLSEGTKAELLAYSADARWRKETGGLTANNISISTSRESQSQIAGAYSLAMDNAKTTGWLIEWKSADGVFASLSAAQIMSMAALVGAFVQACFAVEKTVANAIGSGSITTSAQIDSAYAAISTSL